MLPRFNRSVDAEQATHEAEWERRKQLREEYRKYIQRNDDIADENARLIADPDDDGTPIVILCQFGTWAVTRYGIEHIDGYHYHIDSHAIIHDNVNWVSHMREKNWIVYEDFLLAYHTAKQLFTALESHGIDIYELTRPSEDDD